MRFEPLEPVELVVEFRPGLRIAVRQIDAGNDDAFDRGLDIARLAVGGVAGKLRPDQHRFGLPRQDGDAVPGLLSAPYPALLIASIGKSSSVDFSSCRATASGFA